MFEQLNSLIGRTITAVDANTDSEGFVYRIELTLDDGTTRTFRSECGATASDDDLESWIDVQSGSAQT